jgi:tungstate transport system substrate-binding protein
VTVTNYLSAASNREFIPAVFFLLRDARSPILSQQATGQRETAVMMKRLLGIFLAISVLSTAVFSAPAPAADNTITLATTTSTENSGLLAQIHADFEKKTGIRVKVVAKGTGASLQLARDGNADLVLVHAREHEDRFVAEGYGVMRRDVMYNDFVLIGPAEDPADVRGVQDPAQALRRITEADCVFISRGDGSGTHIREQSLWKATKVPLDNEKVTVVASGTRKSFETVRPCGNWYLSVGQGMGKTIMIATEKRAYTLADRGTYYSFALPSPPKTDLTVLCEGDASLYNPYGVIAVAPDRHPHVNFAGVKKYIEWITSLEVQEMIGQYTVQGKVLFHPGAATAEKR